MKDAQAFWDGLARGYAKKPVKDVGAYEQTLERTGTHLGATDRVLEIGCGTGTTALRLAGAVGDYSASDISPAMIAIAEEKAAAAVESGNLRFVTAPLSDAPRVEGGFDAVLAFHLVHLVGDLPSALGAIADRLRPGGVFISKTVCLGERGGWKLRAFVRVMRLLGIAPPVAYLSVEGLEAAITAAGFEIVETGMFPKVPPNHFVVARRV
ncbi:MAG: class I SAM-dependent methyltransferase [Pseudomonadota bacterium]